VHARACRNGAHGRARSRGGRHCAGDTERAPSSQPGAAVLRRPRNPPPAAPQAQRRGPRNPQAPAPLSTKGARPAGTQAQGRSAGPQAQGRAAGTAKPTTPPSWHPRNKSAAASRDIANTSSSWETMSWSSSGYRWTMDMAILVLYFRSATRTRGCRRAQTPTAPRGGRAWWRP